MKSGAARYRAKHLRKGRARTAGGRRAAPTSPENRAVIRLVICGVIFVALVAVKLLFPEAVSRLADTAGALIGRDADFQEAFAAGKAAVEAAVAGTTDKMVAFQCTREGGYKCETVLQPLDIVANFEKKVPREWINEAGNGIEQPFIDYVLPLIQGEPNRALENSLPRFARLKKVLTTEM